MKTELSLEDPDGIYEQLLDAHAGLSDEQSSALNARLILLLVNQVGDQEAADCIRAARLGLEVRPEPSYFNPPPKETT
jgi:hypothetical protein